MNQEKNSSIKIFSLSKLLNFSKNLSLRFTEKLVIALSHHKNATRKKLLIQPIQISTFLSIVPFILGFFEFLNQKYPYQKKNVFFEKNIPGIRIPTEKLNWETFQYLITENNKIELGNNKVYWSDKDLIIQTDNNELNISTENLISYISEFSSIHKLNSSINVKNYKFTLDTKKFTSNYYNGDEIPLKLEGIGIQQAQPIFLPTILNSISTKTTGNFLVEKKYKFLSSLLKNNTINNKILIGLKSQIYFDANSEEIVKKINLIDKKPGHWNNDASFSMSSKFIDESNILKKETRKLFTQTGLSLISNFLYFDNITKINFEKKLVPQFNKAEELLNFQRIIREIDQLSLPNSFDQTRYMSGYDYPDMNTNQILSLNYQQNFSKIKYIQIGLPSSYLIPQISNFSYLPPPNFLIKSKTFLLKDFSGRENFYEGPGLLLNTLNGLDWEVNVKNTNQLSLQTWLKTYFSSQNPFSDVLFNFFGIFESPEYQTLSAENLKSQLHYWFENLLIFRKGTITNTTTSYLPFERSFQLPGISQEEWRQIIANNTLLRETAGISYNTISLPILEVRFPKIEPPIFHFGYKILTDNEFKKPFYCINNVASKAQNSFIKTNYILPTTSFNEYTTAELSLSSGLYQKIPSLFQKPTLVSFSDLWEPLTLKSWLITSQIGFAFLVFRILKALADNYGRELLVYLLDLVALLGFLDDNLKQEIEILMGQREKGFRIIPKTSKNFSNIGGIQQLLPEIVEIVWFLRNHGRQFSLSKTLPRGVLLTGPPGTGKTLLVQAIAGESEVPVLALSGSSLLEPGESGALKLEILFQEARKLAPCIVFIDEMDTLAEKREQVLQNPMGADEVLESLSNLKILSPETPLSLPTSSQSNENITDLMAAIYAQQDLHKEKLRILMQFLVELDGIQGRDGVVVIGATNRPEMLDPAILRPGRFDRILELGLPGPDKRKEILKLYSNNIGIDTHISWNYLVQRTAGYSAADLASMMNQSTLHAILNQSNHTVQTIEYGIDRITTIGFEQPFNVHNRKVSTLQLAYYQAGKILLSALLEYHPSTLVTYLWPRRTNVRAFQISQNLQKYFFRFARRIELEHRIIGCYAGKAAEILFLQDAALNVNLSDLGSEDIQFAQNLIRYMIQNWHFYGKAISIQQNSNILDLYNLKEYRDNSEKMLFLNSFLTNIENIENSLLDVDTGLIQNNNSTTENPIDKEDQTYSHTANWQYQISYEFELATRTFSDWYRLYLPDPQQTERNLEWTPPDEFYHGNLLSQELTDSVVWNDLLAIKVDYLTHSLILQSFNKALVLLDQNREILDKLVYELIHKEILREPEIQSILEQFQLLFNKERDSIVLTEKQVTTEAQSAPLSANINGLNEKLPDGIKIIRSNWGENSRRRKIRWFNFNAFFK